MLKNATVKLNTDFQAARTFKLWYFTEGLTFGRWKSLFCSALLNFMGTVFILNEHFIIHYIHWAYSTPAQSISYRYKSRASLMFNVHIYIQIEEKH